jgi:hypothetical protein
MDEDHWRNLGLPHPIVNNLCHLTEWWHCSAYCYHPPLMFLRHMERKKWRIQKRKKRGDLYDKNMSPLPIVVLLNNSTMAIPFTLQGTQVSSGFEFPKKD